MDASYVEKVNTPFLREGDSPDEYRAGIEKLKADGLIEMHDSGAFFRFTEGFEVKAAR